MFLSHDWSYRLSPYAWRRSAAFLLVCLFLQLGNAFAKHFHFIEIGTCDFDTLASNLRLTHNYGISVEAVAEYLNLVPTGVNMIKINAAVSDEDGWAEMYKVDPKFMEPTCNNSDNICLPWWFRGTSTLNQPSPLLVHHAEHNIEKVSQVVKVQTYTYRTILEKHKISSLGMLKIDTEGFDLKIVRQALRYGLQSGLWPQSLVFEKNNLSSIVQSDMSTDAIVLEILDNHYSCWVPEGEDDSHCWLLRDLVSIHGLSLVQAGSAPRTWIMRLPERTLISSIRLKDASGLPLTQWQVSVSDSEFSETSHTCGMVPSTLEAGTAVLVKCEREGRFIRITCMHPKRRVVPPAVEVWAPATALGSVRSSVGRECCSKKSCGPSHQTYLFNGYNLNCEAICMEDIRCKWFTVFRSGWCQTAANCDMDFPSISVQGPVTFARLANRTKASTTPLLTPLAPVLSSARQSSKDWGGAPDRAIDGKWDSNFWARTCTHTNAGTPDAWWSTEFLPLNVPIHMVRLQVRGDCCSERMTDWEVRVGNDENPWQNMVCGTKQNEPKTGGRIDIHCSPPLYGRFVGIVLPGNEPLTLCEVEAFTSTDAFESSRIPLQRLK